MSFIKYTKNKKEILESNEKEKNINITKEVISSYSEQ